MGFAYPPKTAAVRPAPRDFVSPGAGGGGGNGVPSDAGYPAGMSGDARPLPGRLHRWDDLPDPGRVGAASLRLMTVHAHPDDEASKGSGTVSHYAGRGVRVTLVTCTGGEEGEILNPAMDHPEVAAALEEIRMDELAEAVEVCGYAACYLLGYRDSGMPASEANANPAAFANCDLAQATARLARLVRAEAPHVVVTYGPDGGYPHPDHIMTHSVTVAAVEAAADADAPLAGAPWQVSKLYWLAWSYARMEATHGEFVRRGWESPYGEWLKHREDRDHEITTEIDVGDSLGARRAALLAHRTQIDPQSFWLRLPDSVVKEIYPWEEYVLARDLTAASPPAGQREGARILGIC